jgi:hypothetical protein
MSELGPDGRARLALQLRERGFLLVWDQADRAGPMSDLERAMFVLERLYPEMPEAHRRSVRRQMDADLRSGLWRGFRRPVREGRAALEGPDGPRRATG